MKKKKDKSLDNNNDKLVVFDPHYPHCVLNIKKGTTKDTPRIGITMAAWDHEISIP